jgi:hypothetical protein
MKGFSKLISKLRETLTRNDSAFGTEVADSTTNRIDASGAYEYNIGRHFLLENGRFIYDLDILNDPDAFTDASGKFQVRATPGDEHVFGARELVRYVPNYELLFGAAAWAETALEPGQHFAIEFADDTFRDGYRYHYHYDDAADAVRLTLEQAADGLLVDTTPTDLAERERHGYDHTKPGVGRGYINWYGAGLFAAELSYPIRSSTLPYSVLDDGEYIREQTNPRIGKTANDDDVATGNPNLRIQVRVWADGDAAAPVTVNVCSLGALIRGNATEFDREKPSVHWNVGGSISQYPTDNVTDAIAARIDPERNNVAVKAQPPLFQPTGSGVTMELTVYAVHKDHPDLTVNFDDPDDDGTDEGPSPAAQARAQTDVMQYTRDVTAIPTTTDIRADATTGLVPDMRHITSTVGQSSAGNDPGSTTGGEGRGVKRNVYKDDVAIFLPRTDPEGNVSSGTMRWLKPLFEEDW